MYFRLCTFDARQADCSSDIRIPETNARICYGHDYRADEFYTTLGKI